MNERTGHIEELQAENAQLRDAANLIVDLYGGCTSFMPPSNCVQAERKREAECSDDLWCDACIIRETLTIKPEPPESKS